MNRYTQQEIEAKVRELWCPGRYNDPDEIKVEVSENEVRITISAMYESPPLMPGLFALCEFFGTKNINDDDRFSNGGCETCDYGSSYGFTLTVRPEAA